MHSHDLTLEHNTIINLSQQRQKKNVYVPMNKNDEIKSHRKNISLFTNLNIR